jgi:uncharacterized protein (TIGR02678 family)
MHEGQILLEHYWIDRKTDKELFNTVRRDLSKYRKFYAEQLGWRIIRNERIIKLEKIPAVAEAFMGIRDFTETMDYCFLCALLIYLDDKEDNDQFLLSDLVNAMEMRLADTIKIDWKLYSQRKSLVRVLKFAEERRFLVSYEGNSENISNGIEVEILYENTGLSRYFVTNFGYDTKGFETYHDFENYQPEDVQVDRGHFRINRVYRQLIATPAVYWQDNDDQTALYIKNQRQWIDANLRRELGGQLHVHRNSAYYVLDETDSFGEVHPRNAMISQIVLLFCGQIIDGVHKESMRCRDDNTIILKTAQFEKLVEKCRATYSSGWSKEYREMPVDKVADAVRQYMESWLMLKAGPDETLIIYPGAGKLRGQYNDDFSGNGTATSNSHKTTKKEQPEQDSLF